MKKQHISQYIVCKKVILLLWIMAVLFIAKSCSSRRMIVIDTAMMSNTQVGAPDLYNDEYVERLMLDGWPADILNTAADAYYLDDDEKNLVLAHNLVRFDPQRFAQLYVSEYTTYFDNLEFRYPGLRNVLLTQEGLAPLKELYYELLRTEPMGLLYPSKGLSSSAKLHMDYLVENNKLGHDGQGGLAARIERFGEWDHIIGENIAYGNFSAHDALLYMLIDDNVPDRSHRTIIIDPMFKLIGVAKGEHPSFSREYSYVINYAKGFKDHDPD